MFDPGEFPSPDPTSDKRLKLDHDVTRVVLRWSRGSRAANVEEEIGAPSDPLKRLLLPRSEFAYR